MKRKFVNIALSLLGVILGIAYSVISAAADSLKPYVPLAWIVVAVGAVLTVFFSIVDDIRFKYLSLYFQRSRLTQFKASIDSLEAELVHDPELEDLNTRQVIDRLESWEDIGNDLIVMSRIYTNAKNQIVDLTSLIALPMLRYNRQMKFIHLGKTAYKRAKQLKRWNKAALIAYYMTHAYYSSHTNLNTNEGQKWVGRMKDIYDKHPNGELHALLLELEGLRLKDNPDERANAKLSFEKALTLAQQPDLGNSQNIMRMKKNIYFYLADIAERESDDNIAISYYKMALDPLSRNVFKQIYLYEKLGQLALMIKNYDEAYQYHHNMLNLAEMRLSLLWQSSAHQGLAKTLLKRDPPDIKNAYLHAKKALEIAKENSERANEYEIQTIMIEISNKMYEEYSALHQQGQQIT